MLIKVSCYMGLFHSTSTFVTEVFNVVVLIAGGLFLYSGQIELGDYSVFIVSINIFLSFFCGNNNSLFALIIF